MMDQSFGSAQGGLFDGNELFDVPWDSFAPFPDPMVAASVPPAAIEDPLLDAFRNNNMLAKHKGASFHGTAPSAADHAAHMNPMMGAPSDAMMGPKQASATPMDLSNDSGHMPPPSNGGHADGQQTIGEDKHATDTTSAYRAQILAHHSHLMRNGLGNNSARTGLPVRPMRGLISAPAVPLSSSVPSRAMQVTEQASRLSLQERRRKARIEQSKARKAKEADNVQVSGRAQKRSNAGAEQTMDQMSQASSSILKTPSQSTAGTPMLQDTVHNYDRPVMNPPENIYSSSGFNMLKALMRVASRPNAAVSIGSVDMSCAFTVSDALDPEQPLIYCSDSFCRLTGYERSEIYGRNCRFLQAPGGHVEKGSERTSTDNQAVAHLKRHVDSHKQCQASLINYRKDGQPFINLVTVVPITWDDTDQIRYLVGFQVDLVEQPGAILEKMPDGSYFVNYSNANANGGMPSSGLDGGAAMVKQASMITEMEEANTEQQDAQQRAENAQGIAEVIDSGGADTKRWSKLLLDNSHDLIYVLSLKGTFLYVSPSVERILGYKASELIGHSISEFTHPSDVVPVFRELKDSTSNASIAAAARTSRNGFGNMGRARQPSVRDTGPTVNLLFRMRTKSTAHQWIESVGKLHLEQGKGRKVVISSGRPRPVYHLANSVMTAVASSTEPGFWAKMSLDGLFLNVTAPVVNMLGITAHLMAGKAFKDLCDVESLPALYQSLRTASTTLVLHPLRDSMGVPVPVLSTFYPSSHLIEGKPHETVWVHTRRAPAELELQANIVYSSPAKEGDPNDANDQSVFAELSPFRSSSWCYELHQLRNLNKRLKEQVRAVHQRRTSQAQHDGSVQPMTKQSPRLSDVKMTGMMYPGSMYQNIQQQGAAAAAADKPSARHLPPFSHIKAGNQRGDSSSSGERSTPRTACSARTLGRIRTRRARPPWRRMARLPTANALAAAAPKAAAAVVVVKVWQMPTTGTRRQARMRRTSPS